jgi:hypothetical protein
VRFDARARAWVEVALLVGIDSADEFVRACSAAEGNRPRWNALVACELASCVDGLL